MRDYLSEALSHASERGIFSASPILKELASDKEALDAILGKYVRGLATFDCGELSKIGGDGALLLTPEVLASTSDGYVGVLTAHLPGTTDSVSSHVIESMLIPLNAPIQVECYQLPAGWNPAVYDASLKVASTGVLEVKPGEVLEILADDVAYAFHFSAPTVMLKLQSTKRKHYFEWSFDRETGLPFQMIGAHAREAYAQSLCAAAGKLGDEVFSPSLQLLLGHHAHNVRWAAAQALGLIDRSSGIQALEVLSSDTHPQVRATAKKILEHVHH